MGNCKTLLICIFIISIKNISAQDSSFYRYNQLIQQADSLSKNYKCEEILTLFDSAFAIINYLPFHHFIAFQTSVNCGRNEIALQYLIKGTEKGLIFKSFNTEETESFSETPFFSKYAGIKDSLTAIYMSNIDTNLLSQLDSMFARDQEDRNPDSDQCYINDSLNLSLLGNICGKHGFPVFSIAGYGQNRAFFIILHNTGTNPNHSSWQTVLNSMREAINRGKLDPNLLVEIKTLLN
jgi:hypothetical protein